MEGFYFTIQSTKMTVGSDHDVWYCHALVSVILVVTNMLLFSYFENVLQFSISRSQRVHN